MDQVPSNLFVAEAGGDYRPATAAEIIGCARATLDARFVRQAKIDSPRDAKDFVMLRLGDLPHEVFAVMFLDAQHRVIEFREMFRGTLTQTSVYPREIVKAALDLCAASVLMAHNHPSGVPEPSMADDALTRHIKTVLGLIDVKVLDHLVVAGGQSVSFAERGLL